MKKLILIAALGLATLAGTIQNTEAAAPTYRTKTAAGTAASPATAVFLSDPDRQIRVVSLNWNSDTNNARASFATGEGAYAIALTNPTTAFTTQYVNTTAGMVAGSVFVLERNGTAYTATLSSTNQGTNAVFGSGGFGVIAQAGDSLYQLGTATTFFVGNTTNAQNGEALYVGNPGRPVLVQITPAFVTNAINSAVARYD